MQSRPRRDGNRTFTKPSRFFRGLMKKEYRVLFYGISVDGEAFKSRMSRLGASPDIVGLMIKKAPVVMKQGLTFELSARYADAIRKAGGIVDIQEQGCLSQSVNHPCSIASFKDFIMCPECGLKQQKRPTCARCGFGFARIKNQTGAEKCHRSST